MLLSLTVRVSKKNSLVLIYDLLMKLKMFYVCSRDMGDTISLKLLNNSVLYKCILCQFEYVYFRVSDEEERDIHYRREKNTSTFQYGAEKYLFHYIFSLIT